ncbi:hypothetical protein N7499_000059 [Penicillium canescens]|nr:hypothetical protein N7499_000059 [Penicillium canescens]KAJ6172893.1 hypothetical protein N7485_005705 [Penicillium canescens]
MPEDNYGNSYTYNNSGQNSQGNHFCVRDFGPDYSNQDGSYYYSNPDGSTYHNDGQVTLPTLLPLSLLSLRSLASKGVAGH